MISTGRLNNARGAVENWHRAAFGSQPGYNDRNIYAKLVALALEADDRYLVNQTAPKADNDRLRLKLAKMEVHLEQMKAKVRKAEEAKRDANVREQQASQRIAEANEEVRRAKAWELSAEKYAQQNAILRQQLLDARIPIDRRCD